MNKRAILKAYNVSILKSAGEKTTKDSRAFCISTKSVDSLKSRATVGCLWPRNSKSSGQKTGSEFPLLIISHETYIGIPWMKDKLGGVFRALS